jgi:hypothetical protein
MIDSESAEAVSRDVSPSGDSRRAKRNVVIFPTQRLAVRTNAESTDLESLQVGVDRVVKDQRSEERSQEVSVRTAYSTQIALHSMADNKSRALIHLTGASPTASSGRASCSQPCSSWARL